MVQRWSWRSTISSVRNSVASGYCLVRLLSCVVSPSTIHRTKHRRWNSRSRHTSLRRSATLSFSHGLHGLIPTSTQNCYRDAEHDHGAAGERAPAELFVQHDHAKNHSHDWCHERN